MVDAPSQTLFTRPQTGPFTLSLYRQVLDQVLEGRVLTLTVSTGENERIFFFTRGAILFLSVGSSGGEVLARKILAKGLVPKDKLDPLIARANSDTPLLQDILKNEGILDGKVVASLAEEVLEDHLLELALLDNSLALCDLVPGNPPPRLYEKDVPAVRMSLGTKALLERVKTKLSESALKTLTTFGLTIRNKLKLGAGAPGTSAAARLVLARISANARPIFEVLNECQNEGLPVWQAAQELVALVQAKAVVVERLTERTRQEELAQALKIEDRFQEFVNRLLCRTHLATIYERAAEKDKAAEQYRGIAEEHLRRDGIPDALTALKQVQRLLPQDVGARELTVKILQGANRLGEAAREAVDLGRVLLGLNLPGRARNAFELALKMVPGNLGVSWMLAGLLGLLGEKDAAVQRYEQIAQLCEKAGDEQGRVAAYQQIAELSPKHAKALQVVQGYTGYRRAWVTRVAAAGASIAVLLLVLLWGGYEVWALAEFKTARGKAWASVDEQQFDVARSAMNEFTRAWSLSRAASRAQRVLELIDQEEKGVRELRCAKDERLARKLEAENKVPEALEHWKAASVTEEPARKDAVAQGLTRCEQRVKRTNDQLNEARQLLDGGPSGQRRAHDLLAETAAQSPWILENTDVLVPVQVESIPPGARVASDDVDVGTTPLVLRRSFKPGTLKLQGRSREPVTWPVRGIPEWPLVVVLPRKAIWRAPEVSGAAAPVLVRDACIVAGTDRVVTAIGRDGRVAWRTSLGLFGECDAPPLALEGGLVVVRTRAGTVVALDAASGAERWRVEVEPAPFDPLDPAPGRPLAAAGGALVREGARGLVVLGPDGKERWRASVRGDVTGAPCVASGLAVVVAEKTLQAFKAAGGELAWSVRVPLTPLSGPVAGPKGSVSYALDGGGVGRVSLEGKAQSPEKELVDGAIACIEGDGQRVVIGSSAGEVVGLDDRLKPAFRFYLEQGKPVRWIRSIALELVLAGDAHFLYAIDPKGGGEWWRQPSEQGSPAAVDDARVYQGSTGGVSAYDR